MGRWRAAIDGVADPSLRQAADRLRADATASRLLSAMFGNSSFLTLMAELEPAFLVTCCASGPEAALREVMAAARSANGGGVAGATPASACGAAKRRLALVTALADIAGIWTLEQVTARCPTSPRRRSIQRWHFFCRRPLGAASSRRRTAPAASSRSGLIVLGMGKLGARELNYSSDIDLIVLYDRERVRRSRRRRAGGASASG